MIINQVYNYYIQFIVYTRMIQIIKQSKRDTDNVIIYYK